MSIKIKTLKRFLLISACFVFAGINYFSYVQADSSTATQNSGSDGTVTADTSGLTDTISNDFQSFLDSKSGQDITLPDLTAFSTQEATSKIGDQNIYATFDDLPQVDVSGIKTLSQKYPNLSADQKKAQIKKDDVSFIVKLAYLVISNCPVPILNSSDMTTFKNQIYSNLVSLSDTDNSASLNYFTNLGNRLDLVVSQSKDFAVPETMLDLYTKALRLSEGYLSLRDDGKNFNDPVSQLIITKKIGNLATLTTDFFSNDFQSFAKTYLSS